MTNTEWVNCKKYVAAYIGGMKAIMQNDELSLKA